MKHTEARKILRRHVDPRKAAFFPRFFRTGKGEYGEGDRFLGITVPAIRAVARECRALPLAETRRLLASPWHEERALALVIFVERFKRADETERRRIYDTYLRDRRYVNNWDLVDVSARDIVGGFLLDKDRAILSRLAASRRMWDRRVAVIATFAFIREGQLDDTLALAERLLEDPEDLMHKAVGWMLREVGKKDVRRLEGFLARHQTRMPRTMLRYAIERFPPARRKAYLAGRG